MMSSRTLRLLSFVVASVCLAQTARAFVSSPIIRSTTTSSQLQLSTNNDVNSMMRRSWLFGFGVTATTLLSQQDRAHAADTSFGVEFVQEYDDFTKTKEGWSYREVSPGKGVKQVALGDRVVYDWSGYTIGYFGRPFQAKGGPQGGVFDKELDYSRAVIGSHSIVKGLECAFVGMKQGGVRQVVVPYGDLSYPANDSSHEKVGPKPTTFSGMRALNFVLDNPRVDRTMLFNVKVIRIDKPDGKGGFTRG